jgi:hypothetical protein
MEPRQSGQPSVSSLSGGDLESLVVDGAGHRNEIRIRRAHVKAAIYKRHSPLAGRLGYVHPTNNNELLTKINTNRIVS